ncbi:hypothetical protein EW093_15040 [Thiospirochaeta perfilievii]|uniref:SDR family NAD(P)-dependent oxidoreductase n=1 Tax=Thiospirochaeta perfilievii TaxID=252967 RepID=A0A5C1QHC9_9SPIO|nr:hypothetical protein EW093_15040 [Thiospirochaeta perfilievii]
MTNILVKSLRNSDNPRVINVNSEGHRFGNVKINDLGFNKRLYSGLRSYGASKTAQLHCMYILKDILVKDNITINSMHPGAVRSNIGSHSGRLYNFYMNNVLKFFLKDPKISANALYYLGVSPDMLGVSGNFYNLTNKEIPAPHGQKSNFSVEVYNKSCELTEVGGYGDK